MLGAAIDVGAEVEHGGRAAGDIGHLASDRGPVDAVERLEHEARDRHQRAGIAGRDGGLGGAVLDLVDRDAHRRVALATQRDFERIVHRDDLAGRDDLDAGLVDRGRQLGQGLGQADQQQMGVGVRSEKGGTGRQGDCGAVVSAHAIDRDGDHSSVLKWQQTG